MDTASGRRPEHWTSAHQQQQFRRLAAAGLVGAIVSACLTALIDAASIMTRVTGGVVESRPVWLHTFAIATLSALVLALTLWVGDVGSVRVAPVVYLLLALVNLTVPVLSQRYAARRVVLPLVHVALAGVFVAMASLVGFRRPVHDR